MPTPPKDIPPGFVDVSKDYYGRPTFHNASEHLLLAIHEKNENLRAPGTNIFALTFIADNGETIGPAFQSNEWTEILCWLQTRKNSTDALTAALEIFCRRQKLPFVAVEELQLEPGLTDAQRQWLHAYTAAWTRTQELEDAAEAASRASTLLAPHHETLVATLAACCTAAMKIDPPPSGSDLENIARDLINELSRSGYTIRSIQDWNAAILNKNLSSADLRAAEKHCDWTAFQHAWNAVMNQRAKPSV